MLITQIGEVKKKKRRIKGVLFDVGGTLVEVFSEGKTLEAVAPKIWQFLEKNDIHFSLEHVSERLRVGFQGYDKWKERSLKEMPSEILWPKFVFNQHNAYIKNKIAEIADQLSEFYSTSNLKRRLRTHVRSVLRNLKERGFELGIVSNAIISSPHIRILKQTGIYNFFQTVVFSSDVGIRKPDPRIFRQALAEMHLQPPEAVYVGDTLSRDVVGALQTGFRASILIKSALTTTKDTLVRSTKPDFTITDLYEILEIVSSISNA